MTKKISFIIICSVVALCIGFIAGQLVEIPGFPIENLSSNISKANRYKKDLGLNKTQVIADRLMADSVFYQQTMQVLGIMSLKADASAANAELAMEIIKQDPKLAQAMEAELMECYRDAERTKVVTDQAIAYIEDVVESGNVTVNLEEVIDKSYISFLKQERTALGARMLVEEQNNAFIIIPILANDPRTDVLMSAAAMDALTSAVIAKDAKLAEKAEKMLAAMSNKGDVLNLIANSPEGKAVFFAQQNAGLFKAMQASFESSGELADVLGLQISQQIGSEAAGQVILGDNYYAAMQFIEQLRAHNQAQAADVLGLVEYKSVKEMGITGRRTVAPNVVNDFEGVVLGPVGGYKLPIPIPPVVPTK